MTRDFEYMSYDDADRIAILENRAAELERRLLAVLPQEGRQGWGNVATPGDAGAGQGEPVGDATGRVPGAVRYAYETDAYVGDAAAGGALGGDLDGEEGDGGATASGPTGRTEALINHGRSPRTAVQGAPDPRALAADRGGRGRAARRDHRGPGRGRRRRRELAGQRDHGPGGDQAGLREPRRGGRAERAQLRLRARTPSQVLWVFSLLTSGDNPGFVDQSTGRKGLEPIQPAQGGDIAWSLNLHHPYDPANPIDSLQVAARAINNIISGATLTSSERRRARRARPGEQGGELPALHRLGEARHPVRVTRPAAPRRSPAPPGRRRW